MEYQIIKWDVLNLCKDQEHFCKELKNKEPCKKKAKYFKDGCCYCKAHAKTKYLIPDMKCNKYNLKKRN